MTSVCLLYARAHIEYRIKKNKRDLCLSATLNLVRGSMRNKHANAYVSLHLEGTMGCFVIYHSEQWSSLGN